MNRAPARLWDFPSVAILFVIMLTVGQRLDNTHWAAGLESAVVLAALAVVLGAALGYSQFKRATVLWFSFGYSVAIVILVLGWIIYPGVAVDVRTASLSYRLVYALALFLTGQAVLDTILFIAFAALVFWIIGLLAGFALTRRRNFIGAAVPAGVSLVLVQLYDAGRGSSDAWFAVYLFLCLLLLGRITYIERRLFWKEQRVSVQAGSSSELNFTLAAASLIIVILIWLTPNSAQSFTDIKNTWDHITRPLRNVQKNLGHAVAGLQAQESPLAVPYYNEALPLGSQAASGESVAFRIQVPQVTSTGRYYWRVRSYSIFLNDQWYAENVSTTPFTPEHALVSLEEPFGLPGEFVFTVDANDLPMLVTPAHPVWVSTPSTLVFLNVPQGKMDPVQFRPNAPVTAGIKYSVKAIVDEPTILQLRGAGDTYPEWVTSHYLQLPANLALEITALAQRLTKGAATPYDAADAITNYLRANIKYSGTVEDPPAGREALDWFLFDARTGFCNYYASAEVILLRSAGIPARMVVGFAQGEYASTNTYVVRQRDLHAWPEVYFPGVGWVPFEPTAIQAPLERPLGENPPAAGQEESQNHAAMSGHLPTPSAPASSEGSGPGFGWLGVVDWSLRLAFLYLFTLTFLWLHTSGMFDAILAARQRIPQASLSVSFIHFFENRAMTPPAWLLRLAQRTEADPMERSFSVVYRSLRWLGEKPSPSLTPAEAAARLARYLPRVSKEIDTLLQEYQRHAYSQRHGYLLIARRAVDAIRKETLKAAIRQRWKAFRGIFKVTSQ